MTSTNQLPHGVQEHRDYPWRRDPARQIETHSGRRVSSTKVGFDTVPRDRRALKADT